MEFKKNPIQYSIAALIGWFAVLCLLYVYFNAAVLAVQSLWPFVVFWIVVLMFLTHLASRAKK